jgi:hypothetical protein
MEKLGDRKYCTNVVNAVRHTFSRRLFRGHSRTMLLTLYDGGYVPDVLIDKSKRKVVVLLSAANHTLTFYYEINGGKPVLRATSVDYIEYTAALNHILPLPDP